jgi:hypothetical protein
MKKILLSVFCSGAIATATNAQMIIGPELGLNMANMSVKTAGSSVTTSMKAGLAIGASLNFGLTDNLFLQPGLFYLMNGCKAKVPVPTGGTVDADFNVSTIQIPINVQYMLGEAGENRFFFGVGPYLGYNIGAKMKSGSNSSTVDVGTDKAKDGLKPMDFGAGINVGYLLASNWFVRVHYQFGFANLDPISDADNSKKASALGITVGRNFGGKGKKAGDKK